MFVAVLTAASTAQAVTKTFNRNNGNWNANNRWNPAGIPASTDDAVISRAGTGTATVNGANADVLSLTFGGSATTTVNCTGGTILTVRAGGLSMSAAATANQVINCPTTLTTGAVALNAGGLGITIGGTLTATPLTTTGAGTLTLNGGGSLGAATVSSTGTLALGASLSATSLSVPSGGGLTVNFSNATTVTKLTVSGNATIAGVVNVTKSIAGALTPGAYDIVTSTGGTLNVTGMTLGTTPTGTGFSLRKSGNTLQLVVFKQAVSVDAVASTTGTCASSLTWQHTVGASATDRYLIVGISTGFAGASTSPAAVSYGAQAMGLLGSDAVGTTRVFIYGLVAPARGTNTVSVTWAAGSCFAVAGSVSYSGVSQSAPVGTTVVGVDTPAGLATVNVTTVAADKVFSVLSSNSSATSATPVQAGAIVRWANLSNTEYGAADTFNVTNPGTTTMSWTLTPNTANLWSLAAVPIHAADPTRVAQAGPEVRLSASSASVSWRLDPGEPVVGFRVWREVAGRRELVTPELVAGPVLTSRSTLLAGSDLGFTDSAAVPGATYWVESLRLDGTTEWLRAQPTGGKVPISASAVVGQTPVVVQEQPALRLSTDDPAPTRSLPPLQPVQWQLAAGKTIKILVSRPGVVRVPAEWLFDAGLAVGTPAWGLHLFRAGREVPHSVISADGATLRSGDALEFYGYGMDTRYSGTAVYWLRVGPGVGTGMAQAATTPVNVAPATFLARAELRERLVWFGSFPNGNAEKFFGGAVYSQPAQHSFMLEGLDPTAVGARLEVALAGVTQRSHSITLSVNGLAVGTLAYEGQTLGTATVDLPPGILVPGVNLVSLVAAAAGDVSFEQFVRIVYPHQTSRSTGPLEFTLAGGTATRLDGFDPARARVLDITDPDAPVRLPTWGASGAAAVTAPGSGTRRLVAFLPEDELAPDRAVPNSPSSWHSASGADLVIVGPAPLLLAAQPLVDRRRSEGLTVALVDIEDIQDEFAAGEKSADALRAFLAQAVSGWAVPPRWVLLLGLGTYDPRNYLGLGGDLVPSGIVQTDTGEAASDHWFLAVPGGEALSIGRLPVRTVLETQAVVSKILARNEASPRSAVLLVSDALGTSDFPGMTEDLRSDLPEAQATVLVRGSVSDPELHRQFVQAARSGPALVNYTGHGNVSFWAGDIHTVGDVNEFSGGGTSLWIDMTCLTGFFQDPHRQSLAVATLLVPSGGAWAAWASTGDNYPSDHPALDRALVKALLVDGKTLGDATRTALDGISDTDLQATFVLLGDPSARAVASTSAALTSIPAPTTVRAPAAQGCSATGTAQGSLAFLAVVGLWLLTERRRARGTAALSERSARREPDVPEAQSSSRFRNVG